MTTLLTTFTSDIGPAVYYDDAFRAVLEQHMPYLRSHTKTAVDEVDQREALLYEHDLFGFLMMRKAPKMLHWIIMRMNDMYSPFEFERTTTRLIRPDQTTVDLIRQQFEVQQKIF